MTNLGGLIFVYAGYAYDRTFGKVGAFSPSYGYAGYSMLLVADTTGRPPFLRSFHQDTGYPADNWIGGMEQIAISQGFMPGLDFMSVTADGGDHSSASWEHRCPEMLRFIFPP